MTLIADAFKHTLCMDVDKNVLKVAAIHKERKTITQSENIALESFDRECIQEHLKKDVFKGDYDSFCLTVGGFRNTVVPVDIFNHSKPKEIFELNFPSPHEDVDYTRIPELGLVNICEMPIWIKSAFIIKLPRTKILHRSTALLKGVFAGDTFRSQLHICFGTETFDLIYIDKRNLVFTNTFNYAALSDVVYHAMYFIEQQNLDQSKLKIHLYGIPSNWEDLNEFTTYFKAEIVLAKEQENSEDFILKSQLLCV